VRYFAYGSNMDPRQMVRRCPGAVPLGKARLADHRLTFTYDSAMWGGGVGHVEHAPGAETWGVLWDLTDEHVAALDDYEGIDAGIYRRETVTVEHDGDAVEALIYVSNDGRFKRPSPKYIRALVHGARAHGIDEAYVATIESARTARTDE
jgi:gamma-glutamylcyclotransferase (GGCT)/AIG2-like uncharacterized protein YtfP